MLVGCVRLRGAGRCGSLSLVEREEISPGCGCGRVVAGDCWPVWGAGGVDVSRELTRNGAPAGIGPIERTGRRGSELAVCTDLYKAPLESNLDSVAGAHWERDGASDGAKRRASLRIVAGLILQGAHCDSARMR